MEEALRPDCPRSVSELVFGFNPCFNGRGVKTKIRFYFQRIHENVSILVLMEEALRQLLLKHLQILFSGFNPCFNGRGVKTFLHSEFS